MGSSRGPEGVFADGSRGLKPIPEDALRPSMEASNGAGGAPNAGALPSETVSLCFLYLVSQIVIAGTIWRLSRKLYKRGLIMPAMSC